ncbi:NAD-dependent SIR2 family protein deacetylase [Nocardioides luteus]|uniref:protein acetyllysine N-acetyltransferase n=1 Tax=Nocardioides luteus TaxID=1844 RepID=A0ABQ5SYE8_9ACTN|nr:Sir2 family NAD-dependent protein deacetylase [Nocardioides luteus]MDR7313583.1 NAD-dependent SIR2 family protein deacetylase [Nocardioides luteus]GGR69040.1 NAD-dependent protein deacetylase [Nocardioides luteus]GLJ69205.1 NAD-dependent protein deacetylase [Nocardioides luteus]
MTLAAGATKDAYAEALALLEDRRLVVLTGAGVSTDSGIPDYRSPGSPARQPMTYQQFIAGPQARQRYWARSHLGWRRMGSAVPNAGHLALSAIDPELLITQNVDGLHEQATPELARSGRIVTLHGRVADVICLSCRTISPRRDLQERMEALNPGWAEAHADVESRPDGDVALEETRDFAVPDCEICGGILKPDVVFFGENVPKDRVARCMEAVDALAARDHEHEGKGVLLVAGSSLAVMSGYRFVRRAAKAGTPVVIVNRGATRGDGEATYKLEMGTSEFLTALAQSRSSGRA